MTEEHTQIAVLTERVENLVNVLNESIKMHDRLHIDHERRHLDSEKMLQAHIAQTLPLIDSYQQFQGEWRFSKAAIWLTMLIVVAMISGIAIDFIKRN